MAGEDRDCKYDSWRLAVDRQEFEIADTTESTDNSATFLHPNKVTAFWRAFAAGSLLAVQVERTCDGDMDVATMVYSLAGSQSAVDFVLRKNPVPRSKDGDGTLRPPDSNEITAYMGGVLAVEPELLPSAHSWPEAVPEPLIRSPIESAIHSCRSGFRI